MLRQKDEDCFSEREENEGGFPDKILEGLGGQNVAVTDTEFTFSFNFLC